MSPGVKNKPFSVGFADRMEPVATEHSENATTGGRKTEVLSLVANEAEDKRKP